MGRKKDKEPVAPKKPQEVLADIKHYIRNERDTIALKWKALTENLASEDRRRDDFREQKLKDDTRVLPTSIQKFIGSLKRASRIILRDKGGTCYSVIRDMFLYWAMDKSGKINANELKGITNSLGVIMTDEEREEVVKYYGHGANEMGYQELLRDIQRGEPSMIAFVTKEEEDRRNDAEIRYKEVTDSFHHMPETVRKFVQITQDWVDGKLRTIGGTPHYHIHHLFEFYDYDYSNGLCASELCRAVQKGMGLQMTMEQAHEIIRYYDRKNGTDMPLVPFLKDVTAGVKSILDFTEYTFEMREARKKMIEESPYVRRPFVPAPNRILEKFKKQVKEVIGIKCKEKGGSVKSWVKEAFLHWDPKYIRRISNPEHVVGAAKRLGVTLTPEEAVVLIKYYDVWNTGEMHYLILADTLMADDPHFLSDDKPTESAASVSVTGRTPADTNRALMKVKTAAEAFAYKSKGGVQARDILHGTLLRFDADKTGHLTNEQFRDACRELRLLLSPEDIASVIKWFDSTGAKLLDINAITAQLFGEDVSSKALVLPKLSKRAPPSPGMSGGNTSNTVSFSSTLSPVKSPLRDTSMPQLLGSPSASSSGFSLSGSVTPIRDLTATGGFTLNKSSTLTALTLKEMKRSSAASEKNLDVIESTAVKVAKHEARKEKALLERALIEQKLASIEEQRKSVIEDYKIRHPKPKW